MSHDPFTDVGRLSAPGFHILLALADGPRHSLGMTLEIEAVTGRRPRAGTLYGAIAMLEELGWIEPLPEDGDRRRYQLTAGGSEALRHHLEHADLLADTGNDRDARAREWKLA